MIYSIIKNKCSIRNMFLPYLKKNKSFYLLNLGKFYCCTKTRFKQSIGNKIFNVLEREKYLNLKKNHRIGG